jgi:serine/threonine-protein kinase
VLFQAVVGVANSPVRLLNLQTGEQRILLPSGASPRYASTGHLLYTDGATLMAVPFDLGRLEIAGAATPVVEGIGGEQGFGIGSLYSVSENGSLAYVPGGAQGPQNTPVWVDRKGAEQPLALTRKGAYVSPRISPDGLRAVFANQGQIWTYDIARATLTRLTFEGPQNGNPLWAPDGKRVTFQSRAPLNLFWQPADGSGKAERLSTSEFRQAPGSWRADGQALAFVETNSTTGQDIWVLQMSDHKAQPFLRTPFNEGAPQFSPDGRWLAYASDESGRWEIYVRPYPGPGGKWQISTDGGKEPLWKRKGGELFYRNGSKVMVVDVTAQPGFSAGNPRMLFEGRYQPTNGSLPAYDVSSDGQRFLMLKPSEQAQAATQINVVQNWFEELKQRAPTTAK